MRLHGEGRGVSTDFPLHVIMYGFISTYTDRDLHVLRQVLRKCVHIILYQVLRAYCIRKCNTGICTMQVQLTI